MLWLVEFLQWCETPSPARRASIAASTRVCTSATSQPAVSGRTLAPAAIVPARAALPARRVISCNATKTSTKTAKGSTAEIYICRDCGYVYDPARNRNKAFASLPAVSGPVSPSVPSSHRAPVPPEPPDTERLLPFYKQINHMCGPSITVNVYSQNYKCPECAAPKSKFRTKAEAEADNTPLIVVGLLAAATVAYFALM